MGRPLGAVGPLLRPVSKGKGPQVKALTATNLRTLLPALHKHTQGKPFGPQALRLWLKERLAGKQKQLPTAAEAGRLLASLARRQGKEAGVCSRRTWVPSGVRYEDPQGPVEVRNVKGFTRTVRNGAAGNGPTSSVGWHEYGTVYSLTRAESGKAVYQTTAGRAFKRVACTVGKANLRVSAEGEVLDFKNCLVMKPSVSLTQPQPRWTFIYLHQFSSRGVDYVEYPHYFGISGAALRVVLPTAPLLEQTCFEDWMVWKGERLQWRRIKFNAWFNYLTDRGGRAENDIDLGSLLETRARIHALIRSEVVRLGGDARRVIIGGASQGCCVALDAALTYPEELGGVVGLVGHVLGATPLDAAKRRMPLHLFHEASDKEMNWRWVGDTVQRLVDAGFNVISRRESDPSGCGHWIRDIEGPWIRSALRRIVFA